MGGSPFSSGEKSPDDVFFLINLFISFFNKFFW
jgi:hypothetical protein